MRVILAGYNVDKEVIDDLKKHDPSRQDVTPETFSASYARISRDPRPVDELRAAAREEVERARRSNRNIIFKMGHHSVAEHAVFNFDVIGVSRLAIEEIEKFRLCSYTEKSQRYIKLEDEYIIPEEVKKARKEDLFIDTIKAQNRLYHSLYEKLRPYVFETNKGLAENPRNHSMLDGWAKEDARYIVCLAMEGQLGLTLNARNLEFLLRRFSSKKLAEIKEFKQAVYTLAKDVAPSIILFTESNDFDAKTYKELEEEVGSLSIPEEIQTLDPVKLIDHTPDADTKLIASILHTTSSHSFVECLKKAKSLDPAKKKRYIKKAFQYMEFYNSTLREFEFVDLTFDLILSATSFAQLKRHRMATLTAQDYNPDLGVTVPPTIIEIGQKKEFMRVIERTNEAYEELKKHMEIGAEYVLTNAHRRRILLKLNARELYHVSRLREDATAQWDIRALSGKMTGLAKEIMPLTCLLIGGKDIYPDLYKEVFGIPPKTIPPKY
jgi:flavin-dependent thymidylate synthase